MAGQRSYKAIIKQAELLAMSPEAVCSFLKAQAVQSETEVLTDGFDREAELALAGRNDPLISLALAQYARNSETVKALALFDGGEPAQAMRLAALSNAVAAKQLLSHFPVAVLGGEAMAADWASNAAQEELAALFLNPNLGDDFLRNVLSAKKPWDTIPDEQFMWIVTYLAHNERMKKPYASKHYDEGYANYTYNAVFDAAWGLAARAPTTPRWANALGWLFNDMVTEGHSIGNPLELAVRWQLDPGDAEAVEKETKDVKMGWLSGHQRVRKGLARLALKTDPKLLPKLLCSDDLALRCAAYAEGSLTPKQLSAASQRDGKLDFSEIRFRRTATRPQENGGGMVLRTLQYLWHVIEGLITIGFVLYVFSRLEIRQEFVLVSLLGLIYSWQRSIFQADVYRSGILAMALGRELRRIRHILKDQDMPSATDLDRLETKFQHGVGLHSVTNLSIGVVFIICLWELFTHL
jgi:hypothetical protein